MKNLSESLKKCLNKLMKQKNNQWMVDTDLSDPCSNCNGTGRVKKGFLGKELDHLYRIIESGKRANKYLREEIEDLRGRLDAGIQY